MDTRRTGLLRRLVAVAGVTALVGAGCGNDDDAPAASPTIDDTAADDTAADPSGTGTPIKIGIGSEETGPTAGANQSPRPVAEAWAEWVNDNGGITGHPVELFIRDTKGDAAATQSAMTEFVEQDDVVAVMMVDASTEGVVGEYLLDNNVPVIGSSGFNTEVWSALPNFFSLTTTIPTTITAGGTVADAVGATKYGAMSCAEVAACAQAEPLYEASAEAAGLEYAGFVPVPASAANYTAECLNFIERNTDFITLSLSTTTIERVAADCVQQGYTGYFGAAAVSFDVDSFSTVKGANFGGVLSAFPWWVDSAPVKEFREVVERYRPGTVANTTSATSMWASLELFRKALEDSSTDDVTRDSVFQAYYALDGETLDGLLPMPVTFAEGEPAPKVPCFWMATYESGAENPTALQVGESGNGATGDLASTCEG